MSNLYNASTMTDAEVERRFYSATADMDFVFPINRGQANAHWQNTMAVIEVSDARHNQRITFKSRFNVFVKRCQIIIR